jgi:hypothetical protein
LIPRPYGTNASGEQVRPVVSDLHYQSAKSQSDFVFWQTDMNAEIHLSTPRPAVLVPAWAEVLGQIGLVRKGAKDARNLFMLPVLFGGQDRFAGFFSAFIRVYRLVLEVSAV